jgi:hypothetical protein
MRPTYIGMIAFVLLALNAAAAGTWEIQGAYETFFPEDDLWESQMHGAEARVIHWWDASGVGLALSAGYSDWQVKYQTVAQDVARSYTLHGKTRYIPVGLHALVHGELADYPNLTAGLDAGLRYFIADAGMEITETLDLGAGPPDQETYTLEGEDGLVVRFGAGLELKFGSERRPLRFTANLGYQFNLVRGEAAENTWTQYQRPLDLEGTTIQLGLIIPLH